MTPEMLTAEQLKLEQGMKDAGYADFINNVNKQQENNSGETPAARAFVKASVLPMSKILAETMQEALSGSPTRMATAVKLLAEREQDVNVSLEVIVCATMVTMFDAVAKDMTSYGSLCHKVGRAIEDEYRIAQLEMGEGANLVKRVMTDARESNSTWLRARKRIVFSQNKISAEGNDDFTFEPWTAAEQASIGGYLVTKVVESLDVFDVHDSYTTNSRGKAKSEKHVAVSAAAAEKVLEIHETLAILSRKFRPMIVPPIPREGFRKGGYLSIQADLVTNTKYTDAGSVDFSRQLRSVNALQNTSWKVNTRILELQKVYAKLPEVIAGKGTPLVASSVMPPEPLRDPTLDADEHADLEEFKQVLRKYKHAVTQHHKDCRRQMSLFLSARNTISVATDYASYDELYFPVRMDNRSRKYYIPHGLEPQGNDQSRGLLQLSGGRVLNGQGLFWFCVNMAGLFGVDKCELADRVQWVQENIREFMLVDEDPIRYNMWHDADKPWQALAAVLEFAGYIKAAQRGEEYLCYLPAQVDGTCNGLQHYSMMMRDEKTAELVNIVQTGKTPNDIYKAIGGALEGILANVPAAGYDDEQIVHDRAEMADAWLKVGIDRNLAKHPVMTYVYGSGAYGYRGQIQDLFSKEAKRERPCESTEMFKYTSYLARLAEDALKETLVGPAQAMAFLQDCSKVFTTYGRKYEAEHGESLPMQWTTPDGFRVCQMYNTSEAKRISIRAGKVQIRIVSSELTKKVDRVKMRSAIAPNYIHSMDASHMRGTIDKCLHNGVTQFSMIHDSFGCHPNDMGVMVQCIKDAMIEMYSVDVLSAFRDDLSEMLPEGVAAQLPKVPEFGTLDINLLQKSEFAFS